MRKSLPGGDGLNSRRRKGEVQDTEPGRGTYSRTGEKLSADRPWGLEGMQIASMLGPNCVGT